MQQSREEEDTNAKAKENVHADRFKQGRRCRRSVVSGSVSVSALALASTLASSSLATLARDMCVAFNKLQLQLQPRLPAYFYPLAKIFE